AQYPLLVRLTAEPLARECPEAVACGVIRPERLVVRVFRVGRDLLGDRTHLAGQRGVMLRSPEQRLNPAFGAVVLRHVVVEQQLAQHEPAPDVGERPEREEPARRLDEPSDLRILLLELPDDRADRFVDQRDPELVAVRHASNYGCFRLARHAIWPAVSRISTANSLRSTCSGSDSATWAPPTAAAIEATPITSAGRQRTFP